MASTAAIFDKISLRSETDLATMSELLEKSLNDHLQASSDRLAPERRSGLEASVRTAWAEITQFLVTGDDDAGQDSNATPSAALKSPMLPPLSPPPRDAEVLSLEHEVEAASHRVAELRVTMQAQMQSKLETKLATCRPTAEVEPTPAAGEEEQENQSASGGGAQTMSPAAGELRSRLEEASAKVPELRARIEDALSRLHTVTRAAAAQQQAAERPAPNTVQRAVLGTLAIAAVDQEKEKEPAVSPLLSQALEAGQIVTRRGRESRPPPFPSAEDLVEAAGKEGEGGGGERSVEEGAGDA